MPEPIAVLNGSFIPAAKLQIAADDLGFLQGVTVAERLRTFRGQLFCWDDHLQRLANSLHILGLELPVAAEQFRSIVDEVLDRNQFLLGEGDDFGIMVFVTPGRVTPGRPGRQTPTWAIEAYRLPFAQWVSWYDPGESLTETGIRQVPAVCWPPALKCRSRMHYYLADQLADRKWPGSRAILLDQDGFVTEVSTANVILYRQDAGFVSPSLDKILPGVSLGVMSRLAGDLGLPFRHADLRLTDVATADEVLLCSTSPCVWSATRINGQPIGAGRPGPIWKRLIRAWSELVGVDIVGQALRSSALER